MEYIFQSTELEHLTHLSVWVDLIQTCVFFGAILISILDYIPLKCRCHVFGAYPNARLLQQLCISNPRLAIEIGWLSSIRVPRDNRLCHFSAIFVGVSQVRLCKNYVGFCPLLYGGRLQSTPLGLVWDDMGSLESDGLRAVPPQPLDSSRFRNLDSNMIVQIHS